MSKRIAYMTDEEFHDYAWNNFKHDFLYPLLVCMAIGGVILLSFRFIGSFI